MASPEVRHEFLLVYEDGNDQKYFEVEKVIYKSVPGPPWEHFARFDLPGVAVRAYHLVMSNGAVSARLMGREITTTVAESTTTTVTTDWKEIDSARMDEMLRASRRGGRRQ